jgi:hypothetical protein
MIYPAPPGWRAYSALITSYATYVWSLMTGHIILSALIFLGYVGVIGWHGWRSARVEPSCDG